MLSENLQFLLKTIKTGSESSFREFTEVIEKFTSDIGKDIISELSDSLEFGKLYYSQNERGWSAVMQSYNTNRF